MMVCGSNILSQEENRQHSMLSLLMVKPMENPIYNITWIGSSQRWLERTIMTLGFLLCLGLIGQVSRVERKEIVWRTFQSDKEG